MFAEVHYVTLAVEVKHGIAFTLQKYMYRMNAVLQAVRIKTMAQQKMCDSYEKGKRRENTN